MKNTTKEEEEDTWELAQAFDNDTGSSIGTTWPPRSYSCTFCRREFRSAQALGGHMNVHRRDRARLHHQDQAQAQALGRSIAAVGSVSSSESLLEWANNGGRGSNNTALTLFYQLANYSTMNNFEVMPFCGDNSFPASRCTNDEMQVTEMSHENININEQQAPIEELDLELRLGHMPISDRSLTNKNNTAFSHFR